MRKLFACLFALAALAVVAGQARMVIEKEPLHPLAHVAFASFAIVSAITAFYLFRSRAAWEASMACPACGQRSTLSPCILAQPRPSLVALLAGGIVLTVLIHQSQKRRYRCAACSAESSLRTFGSWLAIVWCLVITLLAIVGLCSE